jgi:hypothetical protein
MGVSMVNRKLAMLATTRVISGGGGDRGGDGGVAPGESVIKCQYSSNLDVLNNIYNRMCL